MSRVRSSSSQLLAQCFGAFAVEEGGIAPGTCVMLLRPWAGSNEVRSGMNIFKQVREASHKVILVAALVLPQDLHELSDDILRRHNILVSTRPSVTLLDPPWQHAELRRILSIECCALNPAVRYAVALEEHHVQAKELESSIASQESRLHELLWVSGPQAVMRDFPELNRDIFENESGVGSFVFVAKLHGGKNPVLEAHSRDGQVVVVKKHRKAGLMDPLQVERIYREFIWLRYELRHPHIVKCVQAIHTRKSLYLVFEHMGRLTLAQFLVVEGPAGQFLADQEALRCFSQIASALAYCHGKNVCHNAVSLDTVFVSSADTPGDAKPRSPFGGGAVGLGRYTLSGFDRALKATSNLKRSSAARGRELPFVAPEVGSGAKEFPATSAEAWNLGVLLLEASGGLGSVAHCVNGCLTWDQERVPQEIVKICRFFAAPGAHKSALRSRFGVESEAIVDILGRLMVVDSSRRAEVADVVTEFAMSSDQRFRVEGGLTSRAITLPTSERWGDTFVRGKRRPTAVAI